MTANDWEYSEVSVGDIPSLMESHDIEVDSPDGWVEVTDFVDKGLHQEHILKDASGNIVRCSGNHLFETNFGWLTAGGIVGRDDVQVLTVDGSYKNALCWTTENQIPIVDIEVNHDNHRYYTNNISSHNTGGGKSLLKCHFAASSLMHGKNVLYITAEMAEERIAERIDANLLNVTLDTLVDMPKDVFDKKIARVKDKTPGKLVIKEYPTGTAHAGHFRHLLNELRLKKNFVPDIVFVDYLNICASSRIKGAAAANSYTLVKSIAEEIRGLAMEFDCPFVSSSQYNRGAYDSSDVDLTNTSECIYVKEKVTKVCGEQIEIQSLKPGDKIQSEDGSKIVTMVHHPKTKNCIRIKTKSGKSITVSKDHVFPVKDSDGNVTRISYSEGLKTGYFLNVNKAR